MRNRTETLIASPPSLTVHSEDCWRRSETAGSASSKSSKFIISALYVTVTCFTTYNAGLQWQTVMRCYHEIKLSFAPPVAFCSARQNHDSSSRWLSMTLSSGEEASAVSQRFARLVEDEVQKPFRVVSTQFSGKTKTISQDACRRQGPVGLA